MISPLTGRVMDSETKRRKKEAKGKAYTAKDIYATTHFACNSSHIDDIAAALRRSVDNLIKENEAQVNSCMAKTMRPEKARPQFCVNKYLDEFLLLAYPRSSPERNNTRKRRLQKIFASLRNVPMCQITSREVSALIKRDNITTENVQLCRLFWGYLLDTKKCTGKNPFPTETMRELSPETLDKNAFTPTVLDTAVFEKFVALINKKHSTIHCGVFLLASGFTLSDISELKWSDIEFVQGYDDFAIIRIRREHAIVAKHEFSRPAIPDAAKYLKSVYNALSERIDHNVLAETYVVTTEYSDTKRADNREITNAANNLLVRAGYRVRLSAPGRIGETEPILSSLLRTNYQHMLVYRAGLQNDSDTVNFLMGRQLNSSTYTNYESHTSPEAQYRLYTILKPISVEVSLNHSKGLKEKRDKLIFTATPKTNHEVARVTGQITVKPGEKVRICVPHGVLGRIE